MASMMFMNGPAMAIRKRCQRGMREELTGIAGALIHGILAAHFHVAAEGDGADAVVGVAAAEAEQALAKSDGENLDSHAQQLRDGVVAEFMNQNHESQDHRNREHSYKKSRHMICIIPLED